MSTTWTLFRLAWQSLWSRRFIVLLTAFTITTSTLLLFAVDKLRHDARRSFLSTVSGVDLIVGARTGDVQLLLYSVFHIGDATNNFSWTSYQQLADNPSVSWAVPLSLGDSHRGYRVIGTSQALFEHYQFGEKRPLVFASGARFDGLFDAVIGSEVARTLNYQLGQPLVLAHGTGTRTTQKHDDLPFRVSGILAATGTPLDRSVLVSVQAITAIHIGWESGVRRINSAPEQVQQRNLTPTSITAALIGLKNRGQAFMMQRQINQSPEEPLMAIFPGFTLQRLWALLGTVETALLIISSAVVVAGMLGMLVMLLATLEQRRREMALLRSVGARPRHVAALLVFESSLLATAGVAAALFLLALLSRFGGAYLAARWGLFLDQSILTPSVLYLAATVIAAGSSLGLLPAYWAYRRSLADGLTPRV